MEFSQGAKRLVGRGRELFATDYIHARTIDGVEGMCVQVTLTSYRSLPLSCIDLLELTVDGTKVAASDLKLILGEQIFSTADFAKSHNNWWFILETAEAWFPRSYLSDNSKHEISGTLIKVEPYISNGRWHFTSKCTRIMSEIQDEAWRMIP